MHFDKYPKQVFIWARGAQEIKVIAQKVSYMFHWKINLIEKEEWIRLYAALDHSRDIPALSWVRIKGGLYRNDLGLLECSYSNGECDVLLVPRIRSERRRRPRPSLLSLSQAVHIGGDDAVRKRSEDSTSFKFRSMCIKNRLLSLHVGRIKVRSALPRGMSEVSPFVEALLESSDLNLYQFVSKTVQDIKTQDLSTLFRIGDRVRVEGGSFATLIGYVRRVEDVHALVDFLPSDINTHAPQSVEIPLSDLRRVFQTGDSIRVIYGRDKGRKGHIVRVDGHSLTFLDLEARQQINGTHSEEADLLLPLEVSHHGCHTFESPSSPERTR